MTVKSKDVVVETRPVESVVEGRPLFVAWLAGATAFLLMLLLMPFIDEGLAGFNLWAILKHFASILMGADILAVTPSEEAGVAPVLLSDFEAISALVGLLVHYALSFVFAFIVVFVIHRWGLFMGIFVGALVGLALYFVNFFGMTYFFEQFNAFTYNPLFAIAHVVFGAVVGGVYESLDTDPILVEETYVEVGA